MTIVIPKGAVERLLFAASMVCFGIALGDDLDIRQRSTAFVALGIFLGVLEGVAVVCLQEARGR